VHWLLATSRQRLLCYGAAGLVHFGRPSAAAARRERWSVLGSLVRTLLLLPLNSLIENLSYPALLLFVLVLLGHSTGLIAPPG
jgi:hypothetical protein